MEKVRDGRYVIERDAVIRVELVYENGRLVDVPECVAHGLDDCTILDITDGGEREVEGAEWDWADYLPWAIRPGETRLCTSLGREW